MEFISVFIDIVLHLDKHLAALLAQYGTLIYAILFLIVFCETGLVVAPFLPGDSLLFVAGALAAGGGMDIMVLTPLLMLASVMGDNTNYWIGHWVGPRVFKLEGSRLLNRAALTKTHAFYEVHGGKTVIIARFLPLVRTFAPFVAGVGRMAYPRFVAFTVIGAVAWVGSLTIGGYFFGNLPFIKNNLSAVIIGIIAISLMPMGMAYIRHRWPGSAAR